MLGFDHADQQSIGHMDFSDATPSGPATPFQLASCLHLREELQDETTLVAFDHRLIAAARIEGITVE